MRYNHIYIYAYTLSYDDKTATRNIADLQQLIQATKTICACHFLVISLFPSFPSCFTLSPTSFTFNTTTTTTTCLISVLAQTFARKSTRDSRTRTVQLIRSTKWIIENGTSTQQIRHETHVSRCGGDQHVNLDTEKSQQKTIAEVEVNYVPSATRA